MEHGGIETRKGTKSAILELQSLIHGQRMGVNSAENPKNVGFLADRITKTLIYGKQGKSDIDLGIVRIKRALSDFAKQVTSKNQWDEKQYKERRKRNSRETEEIGNSRKDQQFAVGEISDFEDEEFYGFCGDFAKSNAKIKKN